MSCLISLSSSEPNVLSSPNDADGYKYLAKNYFAQQKLEAAIRILEKGVAIRNNRVPYLLGDLTVYYFLAGRTEKSAEIIQELKGYWEQNQKGSPAFFLGLIYANMGKIDTAFEWLERSYETTKWRCCGLRWIS